MANQEQRVSEIIKVLPRPIQNRFNSLGEYVREVVAELDENEKRRLTDDDLNVLQLAVFIYRLERFLREGTRAALSTIESLEALGLDNFTVGSITFTKDNENTLLGKDLADKLMDSIADSRLLRFIKRARSERALIQALRDEITNGKDVD